MKRKAATEALNYLNKIKAKHIVHEKLEIEKYLLANNLSAKECKFLFALRTRMVEVNINYKAALAAKQRKTLKNTF